MSSGRRAVALRPGQLLAVGGMLFSMFFGAGNLILPPLLGLQAGDQAIPAMTGFLIAGIGLPVLGIVAVAVCGGVRELAGILTGREGTTVTLDTDNGPVAFEVNAASSVQLCDDEDLFD